MRDRELNILNNGAPTMVGFQTESATDLTPCTPDLAAVTEWNIYTSPLDSNHCPAIVTILNEHTVECHGDVQYTEG